MRESTFAKQVYKHFLRDDFDAAEGTSRNINIRKHSTKTKIELDVKMIVTDGTNKNKPKQHAVCLAGIAFFLDPRNFFSNTREHSTKAKKMPNAVLVLFEIELKRLFQNYLEQH